MTQVIGFWLMCVVIGLFITSFEPDLTIKEKVGITLGFSISMALLLASIILMSGGFKIK